MVNISGNARMKGNGKKINTPIKLNIRCARASPRAASDFTNPAKRAVTVVQMFAPNIKGKAADRIILIVATSGTIMEEDCKTPVIIKVANWNLPLFNKPQN